MGTFFRQLTFFSLFPIAVTIVILMKADGRTDPYYLRFTTPRQSSMIIGTSRPAQGIQPQVLDSVLRTHGIEVNSFNYGFAVGYSNYGDAYLRSILRKLDHTTKGGVFILAVDPWGLSGQRSIPITNPLHDGGFIAEMDWVNMDPNVEYLLTIYKKPLLEIVVPDPRQPASPMVLHEDGWLEIELPMLPKDVEKRTQGKLNEYRTTRLPGATISARRVGYLALTIDTLLHYGTVQLVRLPVDSRMLALEDSLAPHFSRYMQALADMKQVDLFDLTRNSSRWTYTDGNHLTPESGAKVTALIADHMAKGLDGVEN